MTRGRIAEIAERVIHRASATGTTIAVAESLTGGLVASSLVSVPGASAVLRLGIVAYATDTKESLLGVPAALLSERGAVDPLVAEAMARGVRALASRGRTPCTLAVATTGVAGPDWQDGKAPGEFYLGIDSEAPSPKTTSALSGRASGTRDQVRDSATLAALSLLDDWLHSHEGRD